MLEHNEYRKLIMNSSFLLSFQKKKKKESMGRKYFRNGLLIYFNYFIVILYNIYLGCLYNTSVIYTKICFTHRRLFRDRRIKPSLPKAKYAGTYGNYGYGNITVKYNSTLNQLEMHYGQFGRWYLHCRHRNDFAGEGFGIFWARELRSVLFRSSSGDKTSVDEVVISFEVRDPPVFVRGLSMDTAPPPPDPGSCALPVVGSGANPLQPASLNSQHRIAIPVFVALLLSVSRLVSVL